MLLINKIYWMLV